MANPRPIITEYAGADRVARSTSRERAVRAAATRLIKGDYLGAQVWDGKKLVADLWRTPQKLNITFRRNWK